MINKSVILSFGSSSSDVAPQTRPPRELFDNPIVRSKISPLRVIFGPIREPLRANPRAAAIRILRGRDRILNPAYAALASHYRFDPLFGC